MEILGIKQTAETDQPFFFVKNVIMKHMLQFVALTYHAVLVEPLQRAVKPFANTAGCRESITALKRQDQSKNTYHP